MGDEPPPELFSPGKTRSFKKKYPQASAAIKIITATAVVTAFLLLFFDFLFLGKTSSSSVFKGISALSFSVSSFVYISYSVGSQPSEYVLFLSSIYITAR